MKLDFSQIEEAVIPNLRGGEKTVSMRSFADPAVRVVMGRLIPGASIGSHTHESDCEVVNILSGSGKAVMEDCCEQLLAGDVHYCPKGSTHSLVNDGQEDLLFFAVIPQT